ncbi:MAG: hypothetical protein ACLQPD_31345 [Desulfomonilaceae bacterium]
MAPVDGIVMARNMDIGQIVTPGFQTPVLLRIAEDLTLVWVYTSVDEAELGATGHRMAGPGVKHPTVAAVWLISIPRSPILVSREHLLRGASGTGGGRRSWRNYCTSSIRSGRGR